MTSLLAAARGTASRTVPTTAVAYHKSLAFALLPSCARPANPIRKNTALHESWMAKKFTVNRSRAPDATAWAPWARAAPATQRGGTIDTEMATPGMASNTSSRPTAKAPTAPDATATTRSTRRGETRDDTSPLPTSGTPAGMASDVTPATATTAAAPERATRRPLAAWRRLPVAMANDVPIMGDMSGAMSIAPITMADDSAAIPQVAITADSTRQRRNAEYCLTGLSTRTNVMRSISGILSALVFPPANILDTTLIEWPFARRWIPARECYHTGHGGRRSALIPRLRSDGCKTSCWLSAPRSLEKGDGQPGHTLLYHRRSSFLLINSTASILAIPASTHAQNAAMSAMDATNSHAAITCPIRLTARQKDPSYSRWYAALPGRSTGKRMMAFAFEHGGAYSSLTGTRVRIGCLRQTYLSLASTSAISTSRVRSFVHHLRAASAAEPIRIVQLAPAYVARYARAFADGLARALPAGVPGFGCVCERSQLLDPARFIGHHRPPFVLM